MGTCGAYGGSDSAAWKRVREQWGGLGPASGGEGVGGSTEGAADPSTEPAADTGDGGAQYEGLVSAIALA